MLKTKQIEKLERKKKVVIFPLKFVCIFMNIWILSIFKPKAKQKCKATVPSFKQHFSKCPNQRKILPPIFAHMMFSNLSNKLILYLLHYQTPCIMGPIYLNRSGLYTFVFLSRIYSDICRYIRRGTVLYSIMAVP